MTSSVEDKDIDREEFQCLLDFKMRPDDAEDVLRAYDDSKKAHEGQKRDNGEPYFVHPRAVAISLMLEFDIYDPDMLITGLLHDTVEDTEFFGDKSCALENLQASYSKRVAIFVIALSKDKADTEEEKAERDIRHFTTITEEGPKTTILKLADRLNNLRSLRDCTAYKKQRYLIETEKYILPMAVEAINLHNGRIKKNLKRVLKAMTTICECTKIKLGAL